MTQAHDKKHDKNHDRNHNKNQAMTEAPTRIITRTRSGRRTTERVPPAEPATAQCPTRVLAGLLASERSHMHGKDTAPYERTEVDQKSPAHDDSFLSHAHEPLTELLLPALGPGDRSPRSGRTASPIAAEPAASPSPEPDTLVLSIAAAAPQKRTPVTILAVALGVCALAVAVSAAVTVARRRTAEPTPPPTPPPTAATTSSEPRRPSATVRHPHDVHEAHDAPASLTPASAGLPDIGSSVAQSTSLAPSFERRAVDLLASGQRAQALSAYELMARARPRERVFGVVAAALARQEANACHARSERGAPPCARD